jgi:hypothetical protein
MASTARTSLRRRLGVLIAGSLVFTALTAAASPSTGLRGGSSSHPRTPVPGFLLERGRYTRFDAPGAVQQAMRVDWRLSLSAWVLDDTRRLRGWLPQTMPQVGALPR